MNLFARSVSVLAALGLATAGVLTTPAGAARLDEAPSPRASAVPTCDTIVVGVLPNGRLINRWTRNSVIKRERSSAPLAYRVESQYTVAVEDTPTGAVVTTVMHTPGQPARLVDVTSTDDSDVLTTKVMGRFRPTPAARTWTTSGRYYSYAITPDGSLSRFTLFVDPDTGQQWMGERKTVLAHQGGIRALSYMTTITPGGVRKDVLYATTKGGALKQFQVPWRTPGKPKVTLLKASGFAAVTGLSLSICNASGTIAAITAIEKGNNRARLWTLAAQFSPRPANLTRRPLVAPGANWRLSATD